MSEEIGNQKGGPQIIFSVGDEQVLLRPYIYGWELCWQRSVKDKNNPDSRITIWQGEKYYSTVVMAINALFELQVRASDATSLTELKAQINGIEKKLTQIYNTKILGESK